MILKKKILNMFFLCIGILTDWKALGYPFVPCNSMVERVWWIGPRIRYRDSTSNSKSSPATMEKYKIFVEKNPYFQINEQQYQKYQIVVRNFYINFYFILLFFHCAPLYTILSTYPPFKSPSPTPLWTMLNVEFWPVLI